MSAQLSRDDWKSRIGGLSYRNQAFIGGKFAPSLTAKTFDCINPATGQVLTKVAACEQPDVDAAVKAGAKGIVSAGVGNGNMPKAVMDALARAAKAGVVVVRASRVPLGFVGRNVEVDDDKLNFVASEELNPPKARVLLRLALMKTSDPMQIQQMFNQF